MAKRLIISVFAGFVGSALLGIPGGFVVAVLMYGYLYQKLEIEPYEREMEATRVAKTAPARGGL